MKKLLFLLRIARCWPSAVFLSSTVLLFNGSPVQCAQNIVPVRVPLSHEQLKRLLPIESLHGFTLWTTRGAAVLDIAEHVLCITLKRGKLAVNGRTIQEQTIRVVPKRGSFTYAGGTYSGWLEIQASRTRITVYLYEQMPATKSDEQVHKDSAPEKPIQVYGYNVRVLLDEQVDPIHEPLRITTQEGYRLVDPDDTSYCIKHNQPMLRIAVRAGTIYCNGSRWNRDRLYVVPNAGYLEFQGNLYQGGFLVVMHGGKAQLINSLEIEDYVYSVLKTESWPGWPLEVNKAFAIASRSYVIAMVMRSKTTKIPYHIKNTNAHQTYAGYHDSPVLKQAVKETEGVFLAQNKQPIIAMFDICCGGVIPARLHGVDFVKAPYLKRTQACTFCKSTKRYSWQATYSLQELRTLLASDIPNAQRIKSITVTKKDKAGIVRKVAVHTHKKIFTLTGARLRILCKKLKSVCFSITRDGDMFAFTGKGHGHHLGLCQWGAREMVRQGYNYKEVLDFYYPGTQFMRLQ